MQLLRAFDINIAGLSNNEHEFAFTVDDAFFSQFEQSLVEKGMLDATVTLEKSSTMITAQFSIKGSVQLTCDRSLDVYDHPVETTHTIVFKYAEEPKEVNDEIVQIGYDQDKLNVAQYIYEFIGLLIPYKKLHPKYQDEIDNDEYPGETFPIYIEEKESGSGEMDPRWQQLKEKFKQ